MGEGRKAGKAGKFYMFREIRYTLTSGVLAQNASFEVPKFGLGDR